MNKTSSGILRALGSGLLLILVPGLGLAAPPLPLSRPILGGGVDLELTNAVVDVEVSAQVEPSLTLRWLSEKQGDAGALELSESGGTLSLVRIEGAEVPLSIRVTLAPGQSLRLVGSILELSYQGLPTDVVAQEDEDKASVKPASASTVELDLHQAQASLYDVRGLRIRAEESFLGLAGTRGPLNLQLDASSLELNEHSGSLELRASGSELSVGSLRGRLTFALEDSDLSLAEGNGIAGGKITGGSLQIERRRGAVQVAGSDARIELRGAGRGKAGVDIRGSRLEILLEDMGSGITVEQRGGSLRGEELSGALKLKALAGADLSLERISGGLNLSLMEGSSARLTDVRKGLVAALQDAVLVLDAAGKLSLTARNSQIEAREVRRVEQLEIIDSTLDLALANTNHSPTVILKGSSDARIELPAPCSVKIVGRDMVSGADVRASGCGIETHGHGKRRYQNRGLDGGRAVVLTAKVAAGSSLEVEGRP